MLRTSQLAPPPATPGAGRLKPGWIGKMPITPDPFRDHGALSLRSAA
jgi:hypothetical protein